MRDKYTKADAKIHYFVVQWDGDALSWKDFRGKVLGATDPETAEEGSVRRNILQHWKEYGLASQPNVGDNGVHASASPFESLVERMNWLNESLENDDFGKQLLASIDKDTIVGWGKDPQIELDGNKASCFDSLEDTNTAECLNICQKIAGVAETKAENNTNTAFVFVKPHAAGSAKAIAAVKAGLEAHHIAVLKEGEIDGPTIEAKLYIDNHYYAIANKAALSKPKDLNPPAKALEEFQAKFGISWADAIAQNRVFNAKDGCKVLQIDGAEMDRIWATAKQNNQLVKFGGGFYAGKVEVRQVFSSPLVVFTCI